MTARWAIRLRFTVPDMQAMRDSTSTIALVFPDLAWAVRDVEQAPEIKVPPRALPMTGCIQSLKPNAPTRVTGCAINEGGRPFVKQVQQDACGAATKAIKKFAPQLLWQQSYITQDPGIDHTYFDAHGWVNLVSSAGVFEAQSLRLTIGFGGGGLTYPEHANEPEEWYVVLSGHCAMNSAGCGMHKCQRGDIIHHHTWQKHGFQVGEEDLLLMAFWRGDDLHTKSKIGTTS